MKLLLDTHTLVWWWTDDRRLPATARAAIAAPGNAVHVSAATAWEIATKYRLGKWPEVAPLINDFDSNLRRSRFIPLPVGMEHARLAGSLESPHRDPFDRMLAGQAIREQMPIVSGDAIFHTLGPTVLWDTGAKVA